MDMDFPSVPKTPPRAANGLNGVAKSPSSSSPKTSSTSLLDGRASPDRTKQARRRSSLLARLVNLVARLLTWYSIITIIFRCPSSLDACDDTSPRICRPYFHLRNAVAPHIEPYYDTYAAPYVEIARPYYVAVDRAIVTPSWAYVKQHAAPHIEQLQTVARAHWDKTIQPQVDQYRDLAKARYDESLAPHVAQVAAAAQPYYEIARTNALQAYHGAIVPAYHFAHPYLVEGYHAASVFTSNTLVPAAAWAWDRTYTFLEGTVGPRIRAVYAENVEPQLVKIGKRLGRYTNSPTRKSVPKPKLSPTSAGGSDSHAETTSFEKPVVSSPVSSSSASTTSTTTSSRRRPINTAWPRVSMEPVPPPEVDEKLEQEDPHRREAREIIAADLQDWQERYTKAADEGLAEIDERVQEIAKRMIRREARITGRTLLNQLQIAATTQLADLRDAIRSIVTSVSQGTTTPDEGREQIIAAVRRAGMAVKERAQAVRSWRESYDADLQQAVTTAAETHFAILENIRDLALQKIGMKWAWMDGVTYKDWAKFHLLKSRFDEWQGDLEKHVVNHPSLEAAQLEGAAIEDDAMQTAASTAKELARLKQVGQWKLIARDDSDEFDSEITRKAAEAVEAAASGAQVHADETPQENGQDQAVEEEQVAESSTNQDGADASNPQPEVADESPQSPEDAQAIPDDTKANPVPELEPEHVAADASSADSAESPEPSNAGPPVESSTFIAGEPAEPSPLDDPTEPSPVQDTPDHASSQILETPVMVAAENSSDEQEKSVEEEEVVVQQEDVPEAEPAQGSQAGDKDAKDEKSASSGTTGNSESNEDL
ncbi:hypothetical protein VTJ04DRAFT_4030 [Mycothermus thermophilus]|uniref:uncharacterized protein n=1 Tax=Humicola insolens TaxID=85995 RepID=UPI003743BFFD